LVLFYEYDGDLADHDRWQSTEHFVERLAVPGFHRATRFTDEDHPGRYLVIYEIDGTDIATSRPYLDRLEAPTDWTRAVMPRFRGMTRGFAEIAESAGFGLACHAMALRFHPDPGAENRAKDAAAALIPELAALPGVAGAHLMIPAPPPPMTSEQALRGADTALPWLVLVFTFDAAALEAVSAMLAPDAFIASSVSEAVVAGRYLLHHTATEREAAR